MKWIIQFVFTALWSASAVAQFSTDSAESGFFTTSDGLRLHYLIQGEGVPVILLHGYTSSAAQNWFGNNIAQTLANTHRVIALDARNHGESDVPIPGGGGRARDVLELMDHLQIEHVHMHGYSMGGNTTARVLGAAQDRLLSASLGGSGIRELTGLESIFVDDPEQGVNWDEELNSAGRVSRIDLSRFDLPMMAINGEFDSPEEKTVRMHRELADFSSFVIPGRGHLNTTSFGFAYGEILSQWLNAQDLRLASQATTSEQNAPVFDPTSSTLTVDALAIHGSADRYSVVFEVSNPDSDQVTLQLLESAPQGDLVSAPDLQPAFDGLETLLIPGLSVGEEHYYLLFKLTSATPQIEFTLQTFGSSQLRQ